MKILARAIGLIDGISLWSGRLLAYVLLPLIVVLVYGVIRRYAFNSPVMWVHELSLFMFGGIGVLIGALLLQMGAHIKVDIIYNRLSSRGKAIIDTITTLLLLYFLVVLAWQGAKFALYSIAMTEHTSSVWGPVVYPFKTTIPIAALLMLLQGFAKFVRHLVFAVSGKALS